MPALRTTSSPLDRQTLTEWRNRVCDRIGRSYASLSTTQAAFVDRLIDEAHEFLSQRMGHRPWLKRTTTLSLVANQSSYALPADNRQMRYILEGTGANMRRVAVVTDEEYYDAFPAAQGESGVAAPHPWQDQADPRWFFEGMDASNPPVYLWRRVPTPTSAEAGAANVTCIYRPLMGMLTSDQFNELPAQLTSAVYEQITYKWMLFVGEYEKAKEHRIAREDDITALNVGDAKEVEGPIRLRLPDAARRELSMYDDTL